MMRLTALLLVAAFVAADHDTVDPNNLGFDMEGAPMARIVGGQNVSPPGRYPFMVSLGGCGASLISPRHVLTAKHCVSNNPRPVVLGMHQRNANEPNRVSISVSNVLRHGGSDTAVYVLSQDAPARFQPVPLDGGSHSTPGTTNRVIGWGATREGGPGAQILQEVSLPVVSNQVCRAAVGSRLGDQEICMGRPAGGQDSCQGDSGGPMFNPNSGAQTGIVSWGVGCARRGQYGVYVRVSHPSVRQFIQQSTNNQARFI